MSFGNPGLKHLTEPKYKRRLGSLPDEQGKSVPSYADLLLPPLVALALWELTEAGTQVVVVEEVYHVSGLYVYVVLAHENGVGIYIP